MDLQCFDLHMGDNAYQSRARQSFSLKASRVGLQGS